MEELLRQIQPYAVGISFVALFVAEYFSPQEIFKSALKHNLLNVLVGIFNLGVVFFLGVYFQKWIVESFKMQIGILSIITLPKVLVVGAGVLLIDVFMYWWHRLNHIIPFLWRFHKFHHSDAQMNATSAVRFHSVELVLSLLLKALIFPFLGIHLYALLLHGILMLPVVVFHHSNIKISKKWDLVLRWGMVTPLMHRIHHSNRRKEADANYSSLFPFWDRLFGTYHKEVNHKITFGL